jgi:hypothetical protein
MSQPDEMNTKKPKTKLKSLTPRSNLSTSHPESRRKVDSAAKVMFKMTTMKIIDHSYQTHYVPNMGLFSLTQCIKEDDSVLLNLKLNNYSEVIEVSEIICLKYCLNLLRRSNHKTTVSQNIVRDRMLKYHYLNPILFSRSNFNSIFYT